MILRKNVNIVAVQHMGKAYFKATFHKNNLFEIRSVNVYVYICGLYTELHDVC